MTDVELIKSKLSIVDVVSQYVQLKKAGHSLKGLCPFHQEKTPSFIVSPDKEIAYCFGCRKGGDIFAIVQEIEGVDFPEALKLLAERAGVELTTSRGTTSSEKSQLYEIQEAASNYFEQTLRTHKDATKAREYLASRGLTDETIQTFHLGYSLPGWDGLRDHLKARGFSDEAIVAGGLSVWRDRREDGCYDRFRGRIMFPLQNTQGKLVGFSGRLIHENENEPKYLNSPDSPIFHKGSILYGFPKARERIREEQKALFVEGQMDVIALHQAGFTNAVATSGTALTSEHLRTIRRYTESILFSFDQDTAGIEATKRALLLSAEQELTAQVIVLQAAKDPDEILRTSPDVWQNAYTHPLSPISFYFDVCFRDADMNDIAQKKKMTQEVLAFISSCASVVEQEHYLRAASERLHVGLPALQKEFARSRSKSVSVRRTVTAEEVELRDTTASTRNPDDFILGLLIQYPELIPVYRRITTLPEAFSEQFKSVYSMLETYYNSAAAKSDPEGFLGTITDRDLASRCAILSLLAQQYYVELSKVEREAEAYALVSVIQQRFKRKGLQQLTEAMKEAQSRGDMNQVQLLLQQKRDAIART